MNMLVRTITPMPTTLAAVGSAPAQFLRSRETIEAPTLRVNSSQIVAGGMDIVLLRELSSSGASTVQEEEEATVKSQAAEAEVLTEPSLQHLLQEMLVSLDDLYIVTSKIEQEGWKEMLSQLKPAEFGSIIAHVSDSVKSATQLQNASILTFLMSLSKGQFGL